MKFSLHNGCIYPANNNVDYLNIWNESLVNHSNENRLNVSEINLVFGALHGVVSIYLVNILLGEIKIKTWRKITIEKEKLKFLLKLLIFLTIIPILTILTVLLAVRKIVYKYIISHKDPDFIEFINSLDTLWCLEDDKSKSIITVCGLIEAKSIHNLVYDIRNKLVHILKNDKSYNKLFYQRLEMHGYYYWKINRKFSINEYLNVISFDRKTINSSDFKNVVSYIDKLQMPCNDKGLFQIFITETAIANDDYKFEENEIVIKLTDLNNEESDENASEINESNNNYGFVFRAHHSLGDGIALLRFLCNSLSDKQSDIKITKKIYNNNLYNNIKLFFNALECFLNGITREIDINMIHKSDLSGDRIFTWREIDYDCMNCFRDIKFFNNNVTVTEIMLTALSNALVKYFSMKNQEFPNNISVVLPVRINNNRNEVLSNNFSVTMFELPLNKSSSFNIIDEDSEIKQNCYRLYRSADPIANYFFIKLACSVIPVAILKEMFYSRHATMVFSHLPGPVDDVTVCGGHRLHSLVFHVPNKGTTGLSITSLTFNGKVRFAAMSDRSVISEVDDLDKILQQMIDDIYDQSELVLV